MTTVTVGLSDQEIKTLKARSGERNAQAALTVALKELLTEETPVRDNAFEAAVGPSGGSRPDRSAAF